MLICRHTYKTLIHLLRYCVNKDYLPHAMVSAGHYIKKLNKYKTYNATVIRFFKEVIVSNQDGSIAIVTEFSHEIILPEFTSNEEVQEIACRWCDVKIKNGSGSFGKVKFKTRWVRRNFGVK